jgi:hypothetical protein
MNRRRLWLTRGLYIAGASLAISILTSGLLGAAIKEWIFLPPSLWLMVRVLVIVASMCLVSGVALFVKISLLKR